MFTFDQPFEIHDDVEVLRRMNLCYGLENPTSMTAEQVRDRFVIVSSCFP